MRHLATIIASAIAILSLTWGCDLVALDVGDKAPALSSVNWVKGEAVKPEGRITVVEFWATWCGPCRESIPHLTALQKQYQDKVQIAGLSNEEPPTVKPFVDNMGAKMDYHIGIADQPTYNSYMEGIDGIPHAFLIDATGVVLWAGHPAALGEPLAQLVAGTFDVAKSKLIAAASKELESLLGGQHPDIPKAIAKIDEILALDAVNEQAINVRLAIANFIKKPEMVRETLVKIPLPKLSADLGNSLAWARAIDEVLVQRNLDLALAFIDRALELEPANPAYLDTRARLEYDLGDVAAAIATAAKAVEIDHGQNPGYAATLGFYRSLQGLRGKPAAGPGPAPATQPP
jgi:thiol-disulfide isomerase/thioredoxin